MVSTDRAAWEYETLRVPRGSTKKEAADPEAELNELGSDGWELTDTVEYVGGGTKFLILKRPVADDDETVDSDASDEAVGSADDEAAENGGQT